MIRTVETASSLVLLLCSETPSAQFKGLEGTRASLNNNELSSKSVGLLHNNFPLILFLGKKKFFFKCFQTQSNYLLYFVQPKMFSGLYCYNIPVYFENTQQNKTKL
uniref:Uncharacterized protein n=1 Tax=Anguilla anguilla TaxID=7936 RepID=A0A0E9QEI1_ANGAN